MSFYMTFFLFDPPPQCLSLLGRMDGLGPGAVAAQGRRRRAKYQERMWARERKAQKVLSPVTDMKKVKKFPLAEFLGFIISAKKCVILDMSKAIKKCKNCSIFSKLDIY